MNSRQRILAVLRGEQPDRVPWIPLCSWTYFDSLEQYRAGRDWMSLEGLQRRCEFYRAIGADYWQWCAFGHYTGAVCGRRLHIRPGAKIQFTIRKDEGRQILEYETPVGHLTAVDEYSSSGHTVFHTKDLLETAEDVKVYQYLMENVHCEPDHETLARQLAIVGDDGVMCVDAPPPPLKSMLLHVLRLQHAVFMLQDHKPVLDELVGVMHQRNLEVYHWLAESPATVILDSAVTGLGMVSPEIFKDYYLPYSREYAEILHAAGKVYVNHTSGERIGAILPLIKETQVDCLYGRTYPPVVDMTIAQERDALGGRVAVAGGIPSDFIATQSIDAIQRKTREVLEDAAPGGHFLLGTVDDVPYNTPPAHLAAVSQVIATYSC